MSPCSAACWRRSHSTTTCGALVPHKFLLGNVVWPRSQVCHGASQSFAFFVIAGVELFREGSPEIVAIEESDRPIIRLPPPVATVNAQTAAVL